MVTPNQIVRGDCYGRVLCSIEWFASGGTSCGEPTQSPRQEQCDLPGSVAKLQLEPLEDRALLSVVTAIGPSVPISTGVTTGNSTLTAKPVAPVTVPPVHCPIIATPVKSGAAGSGINPMTVTNQLSPSQVLKAYGMNPRTTIGGVTGDGTGQTIAIVDAYQDPNIVSDLATFDSNFGLSAPPSFTVLNESGTTDLSGVPLDSTGWLTEIR